ncbi:MAG: MFS transporter [Deinococcota bacterium]
MTEQPRLLSLQTTLTSLASFILIGGAQALYGPSLAGFTTAFELSRGSAGFIVSIHNAGALVGVLSALPLERHPLARWRVGIALSLLTLGALGVGLAYTWGLTLVGAFTIGLAYGALTIGINSLFAAGYGKRSPAMVNLLNAIFGIGAIASPLLIVLFAERPQASFIVLAAVSACLIPLAFMMDDRLTPTSQTSTTQSHPLLVVFISLLALGVGVEVSTIGYAATYLMFTGSSLTEAATITSLFFVVYTVSRLVAVPLSLRVSAAQLMLASLVLTALLQVLAMYPPFAPVSIALLGASIALFFPNSFTWLSRELGASGKDTVFVVAGALIGGTIVPAIMARVIATFGEGYIVVSLLVVTVVTLGLGVFLLARADSSTH